MTDPKGGAGTTSILYVEDSNMVGRMMAEALKLEGVHVVLAPTAAAAMRELHDFHAQFSLMLCDQKLPDLTGLELMARVRQAYPSLRLVLTSGFANGEVQSAAQALGGYLAKPFAAADVVELLRDDDGSAA